MRSDLVRSDRASCWRGAALTRKRWELRYARVVPLCENGGWMVPRYAPAENRARVNVRARGRVRGCVIKCLTVLCASSGSMTMHARSHGVCVRVLLVYEI